MIGIYPILLEKTWQFGKLLRLLFRIIIHVIIESDSLIAIQTINEDSKPASQTCDLITDIIVLAKAVDNISFSNRPAYVLADRIPQRAHIYHTQTVPRYK